jgi:flavin reductase (DIM6/NTAB) family NADH-FMN oxidoreductase RutF
LSAAAELRTIEARSADPADFKAAMRRLASGVTVVTSRHAGIVNGMTATAVCSVSAEPPRVLVVVNRNASSHGLIQKGGAFALNFLGEDQAALASYFAGGEAKSFDGAPHVLGETGCPLLLGCAAQLECVVEDAHDGGTHTLFVGRAVQAAAGDGGALVYHDAAFQGLRPL